MNNVIFHKQNHIDQAWNVHRMKNKIAGNVRKCYGHNNSDGLYDWPLTRLFFPAHFTIQVFELIFVSFNAKKREQNVLNIN